MSCKRLDKENKTMTSLTKNKELYKNLSEALQNPLKELHAIYEPDGSELFGDCYCAAVDLFAPGLTFRIYFKMVDGQVKIEWAERWRFG